MSLDPIREPSKGKQPARVQEAGQQEEKSRLNKLISKFRELIPTGGPSSSRTFHASSKAIEFHESFDYQGTLESIQCGETTREDVVTKSEAGAHGGVYFITGTKGEELVVKSQFQPTSATFSTFFHSTFGTETVKTMVVDKEEKVKILQELTGEKHSHTFLVMERVPGINFSQFPFSEEKRDFDPPIDFSQIGEIALFDAFIGENSDRLSLTADGVQINGDNIMVDPKTGKNTVIDNDSDLHMSKKRAYETSFEKIQNKELQEKLYSRFIDYGSETIPPNIKKEFTERKLTDFQKGIQNGMSKLKEAFIKKNKINKENIISLVNSYKEMYNLTDEESTNMIQNITKKCEILIKWRL